MDVATFAPVPVRVCFGADCIDGLADEAARLAVARIIVVCSPGRIRLAEALASRFGAGLARVCDAARPNFPQSAFDAVIEAISSFDADGFVAVGGGTPIGLGKAVAAATKLPFIAVPTTYSGSELASNWYVGGGESKRRGNDAAAWPKSVFYDPKLTVGLPPRVTAASGMNAMAHAVESLYGVDVNPVVAVMAREAVRLLGAGLPACVEHPDHVAARTDTLKGAWFAAGFRAGRGLSHAMAQRIRDAFDLDHAATHAVSLPYAVAFNAAAADHAMDAIGEALGVGDAAIGLYDLNRRFGLAAGYGALGMPHDGIDRAVDLVAAARIEHPRAASREEIRPVVEAAWSGNPPTRF